MNEQLLKLAKESGISLRGFPMNPQMIYPSELQKFAELIVRECADLVDNNDDSYPYLSFGDMIKEHFGVES